MKRFLAVCVARERDHALKTLQEAGCAHLDLSGAESEKYRAASARLADGARAAKILRDAAAGRVPAPRASESMLSDGDIPSAPPDFSAVRGASFAAAVLKAGGQLQTLSDGIARLRAEAARYAPFGAFDPALAERLSGADFRIVLAKAPAGGGGAPAAEVVQELGSDGRFSYFALVNPEDPLPPPFETVPCPGEPPAAISARLEKAEAAQRAICAALAAEEQRISEIEELYPGLKDAAAFAAAEEKLGCEGGLAWIAGWVPVDKVPVLRARAESSAWGLLVRPPEDGEIPPTLVRPPKMFRPITALFGALGISPAYEESDVSVPFFAYFTIFFAMLVGDAGYGAVALVLTLAAKAKLRSRLPKAWLVLLTVFCLATVAWGALTNVWFGASIPALDNPVSAWLDNSPGGADASYHHIMLLCFTLGVSHLMIARLWNAVCVFPDRSFLAQAGWAGILFFMYWLTCSIVGIFPGVPRALIWMAGVSAALVFAFTLKGRELKTRGVELGMLPLNIMSALGDIISYVRLFAVGLASVKVAQNFNSMATGLELPPVVDMIAMALILLVGHGLNFAMAGLSILVHAVRLNTLEFSNHKGITWAGYAYDPFRKH